MTKSNSDYQSVQGDLINGAPMSLLGIPILLPAYYIGTSPISNLVQDHGLLNGSILLFRMESGTKTETIDEPIQIDEKHEFLFP